ncbi:Glycosyltransferase involved in cell wall bisynthesis [Micromonospora nigra]|uniref:Glycosyltransferase involved in cell wall bisynthesis n=1 Tax=Micromonospora nigra TaxID=145857 RepID=A0A1C6RQS3_9ACTN|nr:glycosyltransferase [Micromonospora nigra]SCL19386.1 Glycosyltransferase involved in cell wall bisynthesis [Micromonospora nigra]
MNAPKVSVVVPVFNAETHLDRLVESLLRQSLPAGDFEAVFVDDGSTDGTAARLDALAATHPHLHVLHIPNSGWPSRPRNLGMAQARGEYVFFADDDDWFADEALERLYGYARANDADIAVGKMAGHGRNVARELFRTDQPDATLENTPLIDSLTCHKLFRSGFLAEHDLRFPEGGRRRLEDHAFVTRAYLLSKRTSVLAHYTCYHHVRRRDGGGVTATRLVPADYFARLRETLDIVDAHVGPGPLRDRLHRRWLRNEMVNRLRGKRLLDAPSEWLDQVAAEVRAIIRDRFAPGVAAGLPPLPRIVAELAGQGRVADLRRLAEWEVGVRARARLRGYDLTGSTLTVSVAAHLRSGRDPIVDAGRDGRDRLVLPVDGLDPELLDVTGALAQARLDLVARRQETGDEVALPVAVEARRVTDTAGATHVVHRGSVAVDFAALNSGRTEGAWTLRARIQHSGWTQDARLPLRVFCPADGAAPQVTDQRPDEEPGRWVRVRAAVRRLLRPATGRPGSTDR